MNLCRRCDLAFCERHEHKHAPAQGCELQERPELDLFCCICAGTYAPRPAPSFEMRYEARPRRCACGRVELAPREYVRGHGLSDCDELRP